MIHLFHKTADGQYSASSAYNIQFLGRVKQPHLEQVWHIRAEGKVKFFFWLMLRNRNWTAERLRARGLPYADSCCLCDQEFETAAHLLLHCPFGKEIWFQFKDLYPRATKISSSSTTICGWWAKLRRGKKGVHHTQEITASMYIFWHIWKERGRRIFQDVSLNASAVVAMIRADLEVFSSEAPWPEL